MRIIIKPNEAHQPNLRGKMPVMRRYERRCAKFDRRCDNGC